MFDVLPIDITSEDFFLIFWGFQNGFGNIWGYFCWDRRRRKRQGEMEEILFLMLSLIERMSESPNSEVDGRKLYVFSIKICMRLI